MILSLLTMLSWSEAEVANKEETATTAHVVEHKKPHNKHGKTKNCRSDHDIEKKNLSKYTEKGLISLVKLLKAAVERNEIRDPEDLEHRLAYQKKRGGKTACGMLYAELTLSHYLNLLEEDTAEMIRDISDAEAELTKRGHKCGCKTRG